MLSNWEKLKGYITESEFQEYLLVKVDISSIQDFIFNVYSKGAAKSLRGKSAYINFLTLTIVHKIFDDLKEEYKSNNIEKGLIYLGGGNFYFVVPKKYEEKLKEIRLEILKELHEEFKGDIYLAMDWIGIGRSEIEGDISNKWSVINEKVRKKGNQKWEELLHYDNGGFYSNFFIIEEEANESEICSVCKRTYKDKNDMVIIGDSDEDTICQHCNTFIRLGESVRNAESLNIEKLIDKKLSKNEFEILGYKLTFSQNKENNYIYHFNDEKSEKNLYFPIHCPMKQDEDNNLGVKEFTDLANDSCGANKLGILKLDVDNLGSIFENKSTLQELMATSQSMKNFFEGKLNELATSDKYKDYVYIIFSGGDDTFIVGSYDKILYFAKGLKEEFDNEFENEGYSFSAGLLIVDDKQRVKSFSIKVEDYLENSKERKDHKGNRVKDAITIFGEVFSWDEYEKLMEMKDNIRGIAENESRAILNKIMDSTKGFLSAVRVKNFNEKKKRVWRLSYYLRNCSNEKEKVEKLIKVYEDLALNRENKEYANASIIPVATRLAEFETRKGNK